MLLPLLQATLDIPEKMAAHGLTIFASLVEMAGLNDYLRTGSETFILFYYYILGLINEIVYTFFNELIAISFYYINKK